MDSDFNKNIELNNSKDNKYIANESPNNDQSQGNNYPESNKPNYELNTLDEAISTTIFITITQGICFIYEEYTSLCLLKFSLNQWRRSTHMVSN